MGYDDFDVLGDVLLPPARVLGAALDPETIGNFRIHGSSPI